MSPLKQVLEPLLKEAESLIAKIKNSEREIELIAQKVIREVTVETRQIPKEQLYRCRMGLRPRRGDSAQIPRSYSELLPVLCSL